MGQGGDMAEGRFLRGRFASSLPVEDRRDSFN